MNKLKNIDENNLIDTVAKNISFNGTISIIKSFDSSFKNIYIYDMDRMTFNKTLVAIYYPETKELEKI